MLRTLPKAAQLNVMYPPPAARWTLAEAAALAAELLRRAEFCPPRAEGCFRLPLHVVGSVRRRQPRIKDVDILVHAPARLAPAAAQLLEALRLSAAQPGDRATILEQHLGGARHRSSVVRWAHRDEGRRDPRPPPRYARVDFFLALGAELPYALYHLTGGRRYNIRIRALAKKRGWKLSQYGLFDRRTGARVAATERIQTEQELAAFLGVAYREPADRE